MMDEYAPESSQYADDVELHALCSHLHERAWALGLQYLDEFHLIKQWRGAGHSGRSCNARGVLKHGIDELQITSDYAFLTVERDEIDALDCGIVVHRSNGAAENETLTQFFVTVLGRLLADAPVGYRRRTRFAYGDEKCFLGPLPCFTDDLAAKILSLDGESCSGALREWVITHFTHPMLTGMPDPTEEQPCSPDILEHGHDSGTQPRVTRTRVKR